MSFIKNIIKEFAFVANPSKKELNISFISVIVIVTFLALLIMFGDFLISETISFILN